MASAYSRAKALLDAIVGAGLPARRFVLNSPLAGAAVDCEMVVVAPERIFSGLPGDESQVPELCLTARSIEMTAAIFRCVPTGGQSPPTAAQMDASAVELLADLEKLDSSIRTAAAGGALADDPYYVVVGRGFLVAPAGGYGGAAVTVSVPL